ncbi:cupin domain-containing protein [Terracidiphilus sp.]|uniref:cupin domain-containing protein n=1 Tax=Terracidiphilus sp. TaxID=1964191 RepID=UPI003C160066
MFTRRDGLVALVAAALTAALTAGGLALAQQAEAVGKSWAIDWSSVPAKTTNVGTLRTFFKGPTATLADLDVHVTTLNPGAWSHQPHKHPNEEMLIIKEGQATVLINGEWKKVGAGSVVYLASNVPHAARNDSGAPVTYTVVNFRIPGAPDVKPVFVKP